MYNNNNMNANQFGMGGTYYAQPKKIEMHPTLTPEEEAKLRQNNKSTLSFKLEEDEMLAGICAHKSNATKMPDITLLGGTRVKCNICKEEFDLLDNPEIFMSALSIVLSGLQTIKTYWIDIPPATAREYFPIIPLLKKAPAALQMALDCWNTYQQASQVNTANGYSNSFNVWNQMMTGYNPMGGFGSPSQQQGFNPQMNTYGQQPQQFDTYGYPVQNQYQGNPMVANNNMGPQNTSFAPNAGGFAPGATGSINNMGQDNNTQTIVTNTVEVKKQMGI